MPLYLFKEIYVITCLIFVSSMASLEASELCSCLGWLRMVFVASTVHTSLKNMKFMFVVSKKKKHLLTVWSYFILYPVVADILNFRSTKTIDTLNIASQGAFP